MPPLQSHNDDDGGDDDDGDDDDDNDDDGGGGGYGEAHKQINNKKYSHSFSTFPRPKYNVMSTSICQRLCSSCWEAHCYTLKLQFESSQG